MSALELRVEALDPKRPAGVALGEWELAALSPLDLVAEQLQERVRASSEPDHAGRHPLGLDPDRDDGRSLRLRHEQV